MTDTRRVLTAGFRLGFALFMGVSISVIGDPIIAQAPTGSSTESSKEQITADRFLQVLMRRPRPGTALDRVYGFHVQNGSLDDLIESLTVPPDADSAGQKTMIRGLIQAQRGKSALAAEALATAETRLPKDAACSFYLGKSLLAIGETEKAAAAMQRAIDRGPARNEAVPIFTELGRIYGRAGQNEKALAVWTQLESMFPGDGRVGGQIARTQAEEGNLEEALQRFVALSKSAKDEEDKISFAVEAAEMRRRLGQSDQATEDLEVILARLRPGSWLYTDVRNRIEDGFLKSGDYDALADYYQSRLADSSDNLAMQTRLGRILVSAGRLDEAKETLLLAAAKAPEDADVRLALVDVLVSLGDTKAAAGQYEILAKDDPENPDYLLRWGQLLLDDPKSELDARRSAAAAVWQKLADARSDDAVTLSQIADRLRGIERQDDAIQLYRQAIDIDPDSPQYREYLGEYLHKLDRQDEAIQAWESIAEGDRRGRDSLVRLGEVFGTFDLHDRSLAAWRDASKLDLTFAQELRFAKTLRDAKKHDEAIARLEVAQKIAETPDEQEQVLKDLITTYQQAGTLSQQIADLKQLPSTPMNLRQLAMMQQAAGQLTEAAESIEQAMQSDPDNIDVLIVAADIAERQTRIADAAVLFEHLAKVDTRFRTNYLQKFVDLQVRLGQIDEALATCESLIDANPASPESYLHMARTAFRADRDDQAFTALRRAMNVAPRDNAPRRMMASQLADRYRTDEAIELYWQAMQYERQSDDRIALIKQIAPLYDRKGEVDELIQRINAIGREDGDTRGTLLLTSAAYESIEDYGAARQAIDRLLAQQPRDVSLLETMVRLSDLADEVATAAEFQQRIVALADTPENRFKLVQLKLDSGMIDVATALSERISLASDPVRLGSMIQSAASRGESATAIAICREAIKRDSSLWDVKLMLAELLLYENDDDREKWFDEAIQLCDEIRQLDLAMDASPPTQKPSKPSPQLANYPANYLTSPLYWGQDGYQMARNYKLGRYGTQNYGSSSSVGIVRPRTFGHARVIARMLMLARHAKELSGDELDASLAQLMDGPFALPDTDQIDDAMAIWENRSLQSFVALVAGTSNSPYASATPAAEPSEEEKQRQEALNWRLAKLDPENGLSAILPTLMQRIKVPEDEEDHAADDPAADQNNPDQNDPGQDNPDKADSKPIQPLSPEQLDLLVQQFRRIEDKHATGSASSQLSLRTVLMNEFTIAEQPERANEFDIPAPKPDASIQELLATIAFHVQFRDSERAQALVDRLLPAARNHTKSTIGSNSITGSASSIGQTTKRGKSFVAANRLALLDAVLASAIGKTFQTNRRGSSPSDGTLQTYYQTSTGMYRSIQIKAPLSTSLINQSMVAELSSLLPSDPSAKSNSNDRSVRVPLDIIEHLQTPLPDAPIYELKSRGALAAFAHWWDDRPRDCYRALIALCEKYPDDVDLQIERARLASELDQPRVALDALDSFDPLDSRMLVRKEMAAMNLAAELGDIERAKKSAQRLFGMRMDTNTQLALADQLRRLGMNDKAAAVLRRMRGGKTRDESVELQIARSFMASEDKDSAAEVAYSILRKLGSGRSRNQNNQEYYRRQAVEILTSAGRMEPLIERAERRLKSSPSSNRARLELAELYNAAGRGEDAEKLWADMSEDRPADPRQLIARAASMARNKKHKEAADLYLDAFEKQPSLMGNSYYDMRRSVQQAKSEDSMFERLLKIDADAMPGYRLDELVSMGDRTKFSDAKRNFIRHAMKSTHAKQNFHSIIDGIPESEVQKIPEIRDTMIAAICSDDAFLPSSTMWQVRSRSSGGTARGPLADLINMIVADEQVGKQFSDAAQAAAAKEIQKPTAEFLIALVDLKTADQKSDAAKRLHEITAQAVTAANDDDSAADNTTVNISGGLLWQAGQVVETIRDVPDRPALLIALYEASTEDPNVSKVDFRYSVAARLVDAYADNNQSDKARQFALDGYRSIDHSDQNQYNPGYGDYQELREYQSIADKLIDMGCPIDALAIYRRAISEPAKFERSKRWSGSMSIDKFVDSAKKAADAVTPESSTQYLRWTSQALADREDIDRAGQQQIDLMDLPANALLSGDTKPGLTLAIETAIQSDDGKAAVEEFAAAIADLAAKKTEDWSLPAAELLIASMTDPANVSSAADRLTDRLPPMADVAAAEGTPTASKYRDLLDLYPVAKTLVDSQEAEHDEIGKTLVRYLRTAAKTADEPQLDLALAQLIGDTSQTFATYLDSIEAASTEGAPLSAEQCDTALNIARTTAIQGDIAVSTRALTLALGNGPPLRKMATTGDAFTIARSNVNSNNRDDGGMGELVRRVNEIVDLYSDASGFELGTSDPATDKDGKSDGDEPPQEPSKETMTLITDSLRSIVLPQHRPATVFPYATGMVSTTGYDNSQTSGEVQSASIAMARAAAKSGQSKSLIAQLQQRIETTTEKAVVARAIVEASWAANDFATLETALNSFTEAMDSVLPDKDAIAPQAAGPTSITSQMQQDSYRKSESINLVLGCIWPLTGDAVIPVPEVADQVSDLLQRTVALIASDSYTSNRHRSIASKLRKLMLKSSAQGGSPTRFGEILKMESDSIEARYANYDDDRRDEYVQRALEGFMHELVADGMAQQIPLFIRQLIASDEADGTDPQSLTVGKLCLGIQKLPKSDQLDVLQRITLGDSADDPIAHWTGFVRYDTPPEMLQRQTPRLADIQALPTCSPDLPAVDTVLMLADVAAELGKSDQIAETIATRSKQPGDDADIAAALVRLAAIELDDRKIRKSQSGAGQGGTPQSRQLIASLADTFAAIDADLAANKPEKNDKLLRYPMLATHLIARSIPAGLSKKQTTDLLDKILPFATRGQHPMIQSALGRIRALAGVGRAAGASTQSPLKHFAPVTLPMRTVSNMPSLPAMFAIDDDGWVSGTSGNNLTLLMLRFPVTGSFEVTADIWDGNWGESDMGYGGILYRPNGWKKEALIASMGGRSVHVKVPNIESNHLNTEGLKVTDNEVVGFCNGDDYVTDLKTESFPWLSILHRMDRTTKFNNIRVKGDPVIPSEINPIDATLRGWGILTIGRYQADPLLPIGHDQDAGEIAEARRKGLENDTTRWLVQDGQLIYKSLETSNASDPKSHIEYLRPLMDGDTIEYSFWWQWDKTEVHPTIGRTALKLTRKGTLPSWIAITNDLSSTDFVSDDKLDPPAEPIAADNVPNDESWNTITMTREGEVVQVQLNDKPLMDIPIAESSRPGLLREVKRDVKIRDMKLTGDWPAEFPKDLMQRTVE
ncbi:tetratricopeptide repeat protein [Rubripirellula lacrimiformis]|uniref:Tetratricopeptide repeat protein n=1 Tax=Rubripirellula lacrimiformis TaxID=1930273 RepID=A0A517N635_9BACT|nr:tetratricopeptide repeat protein [Rubripirellula lacrimiformis]QDT02593.1 tetratricopeptide repeat protein [Rubripirellula lacrimiformis]